MRNRDSQPGRGLPTFGFFHSLLKSVTMPKQPTLIPDAETLALLHHKHPAEDFLFFAQGRWLATGVLAAGICAAMQKVPLSTPDLAPGGVPTPLVTLGSSELARFAATYGEHLSLGIIYLDGPREEFAAIEIVFSQKCKRCGTIEFDELIIEGSPAA